MNDESYIEFKNISKIFPGCIALNNVSFSIRRGEVHTLLGENGAGKSTLLNILHGTYPASEGQIFIDGEEVKFTSVNNAVSHGVAKVHQEINMVPEMTVAQNILLGMEPTKGLFVNHKEMEQRAKELLDQLKTDIRPNYKVASLNAGQMQLLQIAKAMLVDADVISFDEPTSSLSKKEAEVLFEIIADLKAKGKTIIYISHRMDEIFRISDRATVLRDGQYIGTFNMADTTKENLIRSMIGRDVSVFAVRTGPLHAEPGNCVLEVKDLTLPGVFRNISFDLYKGEILGFFGLVGAKRTDVVRAIFGADKHVEGNISLNGKKINNKCPNDAVANGIGLIPENRKQQGFVKVLSNANNIMLPALKRYTKYGLINHKKKKQNAYELGQLINLKPQDPDFMTVNLSGGNQQKVIIAKWLSINAEVIIFDEPTKGIDIGAKAEIYKLMESLVAQGKSIIMVSSELPEVMGISDRIAVMHEGEISAIVNRGDFSENTLLTYAFGGNLS